MSFGLPRAVFLLALVTATQSIRAAKPAEHPEPDYRALIVKAYLPEYPYEARRAHITGTGVVFIQIDTLTGRVVSCHIDPSTGTIELDVAALAAFRDWRFKPGTVAKARIPVTFTMGGRVLSEYRVKEKPIDDALAAFLGKGTVEKGPIPAHPRSIQ